jgi:hypothetical protein
VEDERLLPTDLDQLGQVGLVRAHVDVGVAVVREDPERPIEADVHRGLDRAVGQRVDADAALGERLADGTVGEDHVEQERCR